MGSLFKATSVAAVACLGPTKTFHSTPGRAVSFKGNVRALAVSSEQVIQFELLLMGRG